MLRRKRRIRTRAATREKITSRYEKSAQIDKVDFNVGEEARDDSKKVSPEAVYVKFLSPTAHAGADEDRSVNTSKALLYSSNMFLSFYSNTINDQLVRITVIELKKEQNITGGDPRALFAKFWKDYRYSADNKATIDFLDMGYLGQRFAKINTDIYNVLGRRYVVVPGSTSAQFTKSCRLYVPMKRNMDKDNKVRINMWNRGDDGHLMTRDVQGMNKPVVVVVEVIKNTGTIWGSRRALISFSMDTVYTWKDDRR